MRRRQKLHGVILGARSVGEADKQLTVFTREQGIVRAVAKGVRRIPSRRSGQSEPFTVVTMIVSGEPGRWYVAAIEADEYLLALKKDADALERAQFLAHTWVSLVAEGVASQPVYEMTIQAWQLLPSLDESKRNLLEVALLLAYLKTAGFMPQLGSCAVCKTVSPQESVVLSGQVGGWQCLTCCPSLSWARLSLTSRGLKVVRFIARHPEKTLRIIAEVEEAHQIAAAMRGYTRQMVEVH